MSALSTASGVHTSTISAMMFGERRTTPESVELVAHAIADRIPGRKDPVIIRVHDLIGRAMTIAEPFEVNRDVELLDADERKLVNEMIRLLAASKKRGAAPEATASSVPLASVEPDALDVVERQRAARAGRRQRAVTDGPQNVAGEENQDPGETDPA